MGNHEADDVAKYYDIAVEEGSANAALEEGNADAALEEGH